MSQHLSPKQVARAIGVSESSLKRWCDQGLVPMVKTAGGHRRLLLADVLNFVRDSGRELTQPEVLGLPAAVGHGTRVLRTASDRLTEALIQGQEAVARQIVLDLHVQHHRVSVICDEV
ncbi:MAG: helix-turn-helix domain-containing protein, partial [Planctomycetaceae bacterium]|nr:helix-turn-helix domain-containing protein [Planctomycetaceae bacterium]